MAQVVLFVLPVLITKRRCLFAFQSQIESI